jgi:hypothetical protein
MLSHRFGAQMQLLGDLTRGATVLEVMQDLALTRRERRMRRARLGLMVYGLAEDSDHMSAAVEWNRADLDRHSIAVRVEEHDLCVRDCGRTGHLLREQLACGDGPPARIPR